MVHPNVIQCPHCGQAYFVQPHQWVQYQGHSINCTRCGRAFTVMAPGGIVVPGAGAPAVEAANPAPMDPSVPPPLPPGAGFRPYQGQALQGQGVQPPVFPPPGFPPPGYAPQYPQFGMYPAAPKATSGWAISSLVIGILSFFLPAIGS